MTTPRLVTDTRSGRSVPGRALRIGAPTWTSFVVRPMVPGGRRALKNYAQHPRTPDQELCNEPSLRHWTGCRREAAAAEQPVIRLRDRGMTVLLISHGMASMKLVADTVMVLRDGRLGARRDVRETRPDDLVTLRHRCARR